MAAKCVFIFFVINKWALAHMFEKYWQSIVMQKEEVNTCVLTKNSNI